MQTKTFGEKKYFVEKALHVLEVMDWVDEK